MNRGTIEQFRRLCVQYGEARATLNFPAPSTTDARILHGERDRLWAEIESAEKELAAGREPALHCANTHEKDTWRQVFRDTMAVSSSGGRPDLDLAVSIADDAIRAMRERRAI